MIRASNILLFILVGICFLGDRQVHAYKILLVCPQMISHVLEQASVGSVLLKAGHNVHLVLESKFDPNLVKKFESGGFKLHFFEEPDDFLRFSSDGLKKYLGNLIFNVTFDLYEHLSVIGQLTNDECEFMMKDEKFLKELKEVGFDLVVVEPFAVIMCTLIIPKYLNVPFVSLTNTYFAFEIRSPSLPSFSVRYFQTEDNQKEMSFFVRFKQLMIFLFFSSSLSPLNRNLTLLHKYSPGYESWEDLLRESLLFFYEVDHHFGNFLPSFPNHISVAGLTGVPAKKLPENILNFLNGRIVDGKEPGLILMTFGSSVNYISRSTIKIFLNAFGSLNETVIAKFSIDKNDQELISSIPPNVMVLKWLPQNDLLGHPSTKLFITHCGNNGQHEALYHGVPMLGFPLFAEQHMNCKRMTIGGFGAALDIISFTENELLQTILDLLRNPKYKNSIQHMSEAFRDQPMTAQEKILFWIEHVIKHGGSHLRSSAMDLPIYQFLCFDTVGFLLFIIISTLFFSAKLLKLVLKQVAKYYEVKSSRAQLKKNHRD